MKDEICPSIPRVALVTGGACRIGASLVRALANAGFSVAIHYRTSEEQAASLLREIASHGCILQADLREIGAAETLITRAEEKIGAVGVLVNNAAVFERDEWPNVTRESWDSNMETNLRVPFILAQDMARRLPPRATGAILNIIDQRVWNLTPHFMSYTLSKAGLWAATQSLALALAPRIRVNALGPGLTLPCPGADPKQFNVMTRRLPLQSGPTPNEIGRAALLLLGLPSVTGQMIALDGGQHLNWKS